MGGKPFRVFVPDYHGPHPLYETFSTLRATVVALSHPETPLGVRLLYYVNNSLPGATWINPDNPLLTNANDIMPADYGREDIRQDLASISALNTVMRKRKFSKLQGEVVDLRKAGSPAQLVSSTFDTVIRCAQQETRFIKRTHLIK